MAVKKTELYQSLWDACDELRGGMDASQYKNYILTLLFVKYVSDKYLGKKYAEINVFDKEHDPDTDPEKRVGCSFNDLINLKNDSNIGEGIDKVIARLAEVNPELKGIIDKDNYFNDNKKFGSGREMIETLTSIISIFQRPELDFTNNKANGDDIIGDAYEYLMRKFATESGKSKGQFYTPAEVSRVLTLLLELDKINPKKYENDNLSIYDCACGSGSLLIRAMDALPESVKNNASGYGQEKEPTTAGLAKMNAVLHNHSSIIIRDGNTFSDPKYTVNNEGKELETFDFIVANPPFSLKNWTKGYKDFDRCLGYGEPPKKNGDYAWILHIIKSLKRNGKACVILPHGVLFRGNAEEIIRRKIIDKGYIKGIVSLPANLFYGTGIPACVLVIDKEDAGNRDGIFMIDASNGYKKDGNKNRLREEDIYKITNTFINRDESDKTYARFVKNDEIKIDNEYNLNISRYIDSKIKDDIEDIDAHIHGGIPDNDIRKFDKYFNIFTNLEKKLFKNNRKGYKDLKIDKNDINGVISNDEDYIEYKNKYNKIKKTYLKYAYDILSNIDKDSDIKNIIKTLGDKIINDFSKLELLDKYDVYEILLEYYNDILNDDLSLIKIEGYKVAKEINPIYKEKKSKKKADDSDDNKKVKQKEVVGFEGKLIPKNIIRDVYFNKEYNVLCDLEDKINSLDENIENIISDAEEGMAIFDIINDGKIKDADLKSKIKELEKEGDIKGDDKDDYDILLNYKKLIEDKKKINDEIKLKTPELEKLIYEKYNKLTNEEIIDLLVNKKWLNTIDNNLSEYYDTLSNKLSDGIENLVSKYEDTLIDINDNIKSNEKLVLKDLESMGYEL